MSMETHVICKKCGQNFSFLEGRSELEEELNTDFIPYCPVCETPVNKKGEIMLDKIKTIPLEQQLLYEPLIKCKKHAFEPRYDYGEVSRIKAGNIIDVKGMIGIINALKSQTYVFDICIKCGKVITRDKGEL